MTEGEIINSLNLGTSTAILNNSTGNPLGELLVSLTQEVIDRIVQKGQDYNINASRNLTQSFVPTEVEYTGKEVNVGLSADFYWKYINFGVNGTVINHGAPTHGKAPSGTPSFEQAIGKWIIDRGITLDGRPNGAETYDQLNYLMRRAISENGKAPRPFVTDVINDNLINVLRAPIEKVLGRAIQVNIISPWQ